LYPRHTPHSQYVLDCRYRAAKYFDTTCRYAVNETDADMFNPGQRYVLPVPVPSSDTYPSSWSQLYAHFSGSGGSVLSPSSSSHFISDGCRYSNKFTPGLGAEHSPCEHVILHECIRHRLGLRAAVGRDIRSLWARKHREPPS
jgi:hypothetical protein